MSACPTSSGRAGFTLVEIMIAMAIMLVIGGIAATILLQAFRLWEEGVGRTRGLAAADDFATRLARDFASAQGCMGFAGAPERCQFYTLESPGGLPPRLTLVAYAFGADGITRRAAPYDGSAVSEDRFAPVNALAMGYGAPDAPPDEWLAAWVSSSNAPVCLRVHPVCNPLSTSGFLLLRRTP